MTDEKKINYTSEQVVAGDKQPQNNQGTIPNPKEGSTTGDNSSRDTFSKTGSSSKTSEDKK